jgi:uncharacterized protein (TIGR02444 family)
MTSREHGLEAESWTFALQIYDEPNVADACLRLQTEAGVDVMLLLVAAFAAAELGLHLDAADVEAMDAACHPWREQIVRPLRALRVTLKTGPAPAPSAASEHLRAAIKASELAAERLQNTLLTQWLRQKDRNAGARRPATRDELTATLLRIVIHSAGSRATDAELAPLVDTIAEAAIRISR